MSLSKKLRFDVFKRDGFKCGYCGRTPPEIVLECDHIRPRAEKGTDDINNLITACFDCNRGKAAGKLSDIPVSLAQNLAAIKEKAMQVDAYNRVIKLAAKKVDAAINEIDSVFNEHFPDRCLSPAFKNGSLRTFLAHRPKEVLIDWMHQACAKITEPSRAIQYFCGIYWTVANDEKAEAKRNATH